MTPEESEKILSRAVHALGEHYDHVQILVSWNEGGLTHAGKWGAGNWFARQGMAHEFINADMAQENARQLKDAINPPDEDGEKWKGGS